MSKEISLGEHLKPITKKLIIQFKGSLNEFSKNPSLAIWRLEDTENDSDDEKNDSDDNTLKKQVILIQATILKIKSTLPFEIDVTIPQIKKRNYVRNQSSKIHYIAFANEVSYTLNEVLQEPSEELNSLYLKDQKNNSKIYLPKNLYDDIIQIPNSKCSWIHKNNPIIKVIKDNADTFQLHLTANDLVDGNFYKVDNKIISDCAESLSDHLEKKFPIIDLNDFIVKITRSDHKKWNDIENKISNSVAIEKVLSLTRDFLMVLELKYHIP